MLARVSAALLGVALFAGTACAQETTIKFTLGWKTQGSDAAFFYAKDNGYFKEEGLNVVIDQGEGSGATVTRIMSGAYDAGFGDIATRDVTLEVSIPEDSIFDRETVDALRLDAERAAKAWGDLKALRDSFKGQDGALHIALAYWIVQARNDR